MLRVGGFTPAGQFIGSGVQARAPTSFAKSKLNLLRSPPANSVHVALSSVQPCWQSPCDAMHGKNWMAPALSHLQPLAAAAQTLAQLSGSKAWPAVQAV